MSADTEQAPLPGLDIPEDEKEVPTPEDHLLGEVPNGSASNLGTNVDRGEYFCSDCRKRITRNTKNHKEYGHDTDCDHHETAGVVQS